MVPRTPPTATLGWSISAVLMLGQNHSMLISKPSGGSSDWSLILWLKSLLDPPVLVKEKKKKNACWTLLQAKQSEGEGWSVSALIC